MAKKKQEELTGHLEEAQPVADVEQLKEAAPRLYEDAAPAEIAPVKVKAVAIKTGPILRGEKGERILALQAALAMHGYLQPRSMKADGSFDGIAGPELLICAYNYALERNFNYHDDEWRSIPEAVVTQALSNQPVYVRGVDVAKYQPVFDFDAAKAYGMSFAVIKATDIGHESNNSFTDALFKTHWQNAAEAGVPKTGYMFWHPALDPIKQALYFIAQTAAMYQSGNCLRPVIDVERNDKVSPKEVNLRLQKVIDTLTAHFGKTPIIYTSRRVCLEQGIKVGGECPVWLAYYVPTRDIDPSPSKKNPQPTFRVGPPVPDQWSDWKIWQSGYGPHYPGLRDGDEIDRNLVKGDLADLML